MGCPKNASTIAVQHSMCALDASFKPNLRSRRPAGTAMQPAELQNAERTSASTQTRQQRQYGDLQLHNIYKVETNMDNQINTKLKFEVGLEPKRQQPKSNLLDACSNMKDRIQQTNFEEQLNH